MKRIFSAAAVLVASVATAAHACEAPPPHLYAGDGDLVERSPRIVLAEVIGEAGVQVVAPDDWVARSLTPFRLRVVENIKGDGPDEVIVYGDPGVLRTTVDGDIEIDNPNAGSTQTDFNGHRSDEFWKYRSPTWSYGGAVQGTDCLAHPAFVEGQRYLVFMGPQHVSGYELILRDDDAWLEFVRKMVEYFELHD